MANMAIVVGCHTANIHTHFTSQLRLKHFFLFAQSIVQLQFGPLMPIDILFLLLTLGSYSHVTTNSTLTALQSRARVRRDPPPSVSCSEADIAPRNGKCGKIQWRT